MSNEQVEAAREAIIQWAKHEVVSRRSPNPEVVALVMDLENAEARALGGVGAIPAVDSKFFKDFFGKPPQ